MLAKYCSIVLASVAALVSVSLAFDILLPTNKNCGGSQIMHPSCGNDSYYPSSYQVIQRSLPVLFVAGLVAMIVVILLYLQYQQRRFVERDEVKQASAS